MPGSPRGLLPPATAGGRKRTARTARAFAALLLTCAAAGPAVAGKADGLEVKTPRLHLWFSLEGATPVAWRACHPACEAAGATSAGFATDAEPPPARLVLRGPDSRIDLEGLRFTAGARGNGPGRIVTFHGDLPAEGVRIVKSFEVSPGGYEVVMTVRLLGPAAAAFAAGRRLDLEMSAGRDLVPPPASGFSASLDTLERVVVVGGDAHTLGADGRGAAALRAGDWVGFRNRFWALLVRSDDTLAVAPQPGATSPLVLSREAGALAARYVFYSGPLDRSSLVTADPALGGLLFSGLWSWLRLLSLALLFLLHGLMALVGHPGLAIIALAVSVKALLLPVTALADRLQHGVDATRARLQPRIDAIRSTSRGEDQTRRIVALYRDEGVHPLYTLKSLLGVLIQLPVFIAAFDMLAEDFRLHRASFLWIVDLAKPDALAPLPIALPFFGGHLNALPVLMTAISLTAALRFDASALTPALVRHQRRNLVGMAVLFFLLFYTFPAGMVLYWTSTNAVQLAGRELARRRRRPPVRSRASNTSSRSRPA